MDFLPRAPPIPRNSVTHGGTGRHTPGPGVAVGGVIARGHLRRGTGQSIADTWREGAVTYLGIQVPDFPNLFPPGVSARRTPW